MKIRQNLHIHTAHSCDSGCATLADVQSEMMALGMTEFGISDHMHTRYNLCDIEGARNDFFAYTRPPQFHFGVELSCMSKWECERIARGEYTICPEHIDDPVYGLLYHGVDDGADLSPFIDLDEQDKKRLKLEYVIGGVHNPLNRWTLDRDELLEDICSQHVFLAENPLIDVLAHPWDGIEIMCCWMDWLGVTGKGRFNKESRDYSVFDCLGKYSERIVAALKKNNKPAELNIATLMLTSRPLEIVKKYWKMLAEWREEGIKFVLGTDQHSAHNCTGCLLAAEQLLDLYGFKEEHIKYLFEK